MISLLKITKIKKIACGGPEKSEKKPIFEHFPPNDSFVCFPRDSGLFIPTTGRRLIFPVRVETLVKRVAVRAVGGGMRNPDSHGIAQSENEVVISRNAPQAIFFENYAVESGKNRRFGGLCTLQEQHESLFPLFFTSVCPPGLIV